MPTQIKLQFILLTIFSAFIFFISCDDTVTGDDIDNRVIPDSNVSYSKHIQPVLNLKCTSSGCHDDAARAGGLSLTTWSNTTSDPNIVFPGKPENSVLVWSVEGLNGASLMPPPPPEGNVPPFTENQVEGLKTWIREGAKNN
ncbi:MAG: hypothetical protein K9J16_07350 [Melioribacteraceae bacterium]|nr:hypothetical protein [Melioribacteraceae bacterium]MCF8353408.1 hypothetical protein [Melioribacteraceae bacterium]MCF8396375.1 hypothetical protein [Melioribacteraceae bacterium]MCF8418969.1 hypothetical protein [Melioribacteraceae bacterium]